MKIEANGISVNYEIEGEGENLVLIHGAGENLNMWYHQVPVFSKSYRVIAYDVRGAGETESPEGEYSVSVFAEDAYQLMNAIGVSEACFLGYSMGGRIALDLALNHPELIKALILASSPIGIAPPSPQDGEQRRPMPQISSKDDLRALAEMMATSAFSPGFKSRKPGEYERYIDIKLQNKPEGISRMMRSLGSSASPPDLSRLKCPVLIIVGENDPLVGVEPGKWTHQELSDSKLVVLPAGHAVAMELPEEFNAAVLEFLSAIKGR